MNKRMREKCSFEARGCTTDVHPGRTGSKEAVRSVSFFYFHYSFARLSSAALTQRDIGFEAWRPVPNGFSYSWELSV